MFKSRTFKFLMIFQVLALTLILLSIGQTSPSRAAAVRIMPLGNSITGSPGCWRSILWNDLQDNGYTNIDFVGTLPPQGCALPYDGDNEGHGGALVTNVADQNLLSGWLSATNPDIVMMHFGTNDVWSARSTATILNAYSTLVDQMRANNPNMKILVAQIIPMDPARSCSDCDQRIVELNNAIPGWASGKSTAQSPIIVVDQWTGFDVLSDTYDGVHPNDSGDQKISDKWYPALAALLSGSPTTVPPTPTSYACTESEITGVVYAGSAGPGNELSGAAVTCAVSGSSQCATSCTPPNLTTGSNGTFSFTVEHYFDTFTLSASAPGYQSATCSVACTYYGGCETCEIVLIPEATLVPTTSVPPTSVPGGVYQAEDATLGGGVSVDSNHSGYEGTGFVNFPSSGGYVEYRNVDGGTGGSRTLRFRHALGATSSRTGQLTVNGASRNITFSPTGSWDSWAILEVTANLNAGASNTIRLQSTGQDLANQDQMEVVGSTVPTATPVTVVPPTSTPVTVVPPTSTPVTVVPPTSTPVTVVPPTSTPVQAACSVNYVIQNDWGSGATINATIRNNGTSDINGWTLCWTFPGNQQIAHLWNGSYTQSGVSVCVSDAGWNALIRANGGTAGFGFNLTYGGSNDEPTDFTLNGVACEIE